MRAVSTSLLLSTLLFASGCEHLPAIVSGISKAFECLPALRSIGESIATTVENTGQWDSILSA
jgi:hypothetical protein